MGLNIDELLKLDRLRDTKVEGAGTKKTIEICRDADRVLKDTEEHIYEIVEVVDGAFIDEVGIVDEIVRMTFHDETYERSLNDHFNYSGRKVEKHGFYLRYKKTDDSHPFNLIFRKAEKAYMGAFKSKSGKKSREEYFEEDHRSQARLIVFEILAGVNKKFNESFVKTFNLDLTNINDFKIILLDLELALSVQRYIVQVVATEAHKIAFKGRNNDYILGQKKVNGVKEKTTKNIKSFSLDKTYNDSNEAHDFVGIEEGVYKDEDMLIHDKIEEDEEELVQEDNLYKYILANIDKILTKKQLLYLKAYLKNEDEVYLGTIAAANTRDGMNSTRAYYKNKIRKYIEEYLNKDLYITKVNSKFEFKESVLIALENILKKSSKRDIFIELCKYLKQENTVLENILIDAIYGLDVKYYYPIVTYIDEPGNVYEEYLEDGFDTVIDTLQRVYNFNAKNNNIIYNLNRNNKELQVEELLKKVLNGNKEGFVARGKSNNWMTVRNLKVRLEDIEEVKLTNKTIKDVLNKYGYDISSCTKKNYEEVYRVFVLGHEIKKKDTFKKKKRVFDLTIKQSKQVENYIDNNLKLDKLLRTNRNVAHLRLCDVRDLLEDMLDVKQLSVEEIYELLLQCDYSLDLRNGSKQINGVKMPAHKIQKIA